METAQLQRKRRTGNSNLHRLTHPAKKSIRMVFPSTPRASKVLPGIGVLDVLLHVGQPIIALANTRRITTTTRREMEETAIILIPIPIPEMRMHGLATRITTLKSTWG